ncbi:hypothetical protein Syun_008685 [Stephania yunnanensis]|uniref:Protein kinase domain-containing protein n=1 Tax=Stephania yunnanensis TaxID=152371 RepID=A0AAP0KD15_9MAGN
MAIPWRFPWHEQGRALARARSCLGTDKVTPWHGQNIPWQGLTNLDLGVDQVKVRLVSFFDVPYWSWGNGLTSTIRRGDSPRGGMDKEARKTLEHALGNHAKARPMDGPWCRPPRTGGTRMDRAPGPSPLCVWSAGRRATPLPDHLWWCPASIGGPFQPTVWTTMRVEVVVTPPLPFLSYCASTMPSPTTSLSPVLATIGGVWKAHRGICRPRLLREHKKGLARDIWALGCVVVEMLCEQSTFSIKPGESLEDFLDRIGFGGESPRISVGISREAHDFLKRCFVRNSKSRWNASTLLSHPFLKDHIPNAEEYMQYNMESN